MHAQELRDEVALACSALQQHLHSAQDVLQRLSALSRYSTGDEVVRARIAVACIVLECNKAFAEQRRLRLVGLINQYEDREHTVGPQVLDQVLSVLESGMRELHMDLSDVLRPRIPRPDCTSSKGDMGVVDARSDG